MTYYFGNKVILKTYIRKDLISEELITGAQCN